MHHRIDRLSRAALARARDRRRPAAREAARDDADSSADGPRYRDAGAAGRRIGRREFPSRCSASPPAALERLLADRVATSRALGEVLSEPKPAPGSSARSPRVPAHAIALARRTRMLYDERFVFVNGEAYRAGGRDATLMRQLADRRTARREERGRASVAAAELLAEWLSAGWCVAEPERFDEETT
jgi:50S ribosomal protein L16 3-hydroxylase